MEDQRVLTVLKISFMLFFFFLVIIFGTLPLRSRSFHANPSLRTIGATFAGCLFLNVAILHILPEASHSLEKFLKDGDQQEEVFPLAPLFMMVGFIITILLTRVVSFHSHEDNNLLGPSSQNQKHQDFRNQPENKKIQRGSEKLQEELVRNSKDFEGPVNKSLLNQSFLLTIAIYFHTIFEGIAIGVQNNLTGFLAIAVAIAFHKWADAFSMGCHYNNKKIKKKLAYGLIITQAILNIFSIGLGWIISSYGEVAQAICLSISAGTFLAISTIQILGQQLHHRNKIVLKFGLLIGATLFISLIWFIQNRVFSEN